MRSMSSWTSAWRLMVAAVILAAQGASAQCDLDTLASIGGRPFDVAVDGQTLYVANGRGGMLIYDIADPDSPALIASTFEADNARAISVVDGLAYVGVRYSGLHIFDVANPDAPTLVSTLTFGEHVSNIDVAAGVVYVSAFDDGLVIIDVADPARPAVIAEYPCFARDVCVHAAHAFVCCDDELHILDVADPADPTLLSTTPMPDAPVGVDVQGDLAAVAVREAGVILLDVARPASPGALAQFLTAEDTVDLVLDGDRLYVTDGGFSDTSHLSIIDIDDPASPAIVGAAAFTQALRALPLGDRVIVADEFKGLHILDVRDPKAPRLVNSRQVPQFATSVAANETTAFVSNGGDGLFIVDITNPNLPDIIAVHDTPGGESRIVLAGDRLYMGKASAGMEIVDVSDPAAPATLSFYQPGASVYGVRQSGDVAYVAATSGGLHIVDVADPTAPDLVDVYTTSGDVRTVAVRDSIACLGVTPGLIEIVDLNTLESLAVIETTDNIRSMQIVDDVLYVAAQQAGLIIIDISTHAAPVVLATVAIEEVEDVAVVNDKAWVAALFDDLIVLDVSDPAAPLPIGAESINDAAFGVAPAGDILCVAARYQGLAVIDSAVCTACPADVNNDGVLNILDFVAFQLQWKAGDPGTDCDGDGALTILDFACYQALFLAGC